MTFFNITIFKNEFLTQQLNPLITNLKLQYFRYKVKEVGFSWEQYVQKNPVSKNHDIM
jgi:hypothetical protein